MWQACTSAEPRHQHSLPLAEYATCHQVALENSVYSAACAPAGVSHTQAVAALGRDTARLCYSSVKARLVLLAAVVVAVGGGRRGPAHDSDSAGRIAAARLDTDSGRSEYTRRCCRSVAREYASWFEGALMMIPLKDYVRI